MEHFLLSLSAVAVLGISAQWLGWRLQLPSILLLLVFGILAGPVTGFIQPELLFGNLLYPFVSLSVAVILFEGGLSLSLKEFRSVGGVMSRLVTLGAMLTWLISLSMAHWILGFEWPLATLLGAILIVTGPTVIIPMLRHIRPSGIVGPTLKWEGIVIDPIGAVLAVLVFEAIALGSANWTDIAGTLFNTVLIGSLAGILGAFIMVLFLKKDWVPDFLQNPVTLMLVVAIFTAANLLQHESGLLAVTVMGFAMANQKTVNVHHIIEFKENLRVMLIATVFILLAANLHTEEVAKVWLASFAFLLVLLFVVRPTSVFISTLGSKLELRDKLFMAWMAPRGIVAAAISSIFALRLHDIAYPGAEKLVAVTFFIIIGTVVVYSLSAGLVAKRLGLVRAEAEGILFLGGRFWVRRLAKALKDEGYPVMLVDNSLHNILAARMEGIAAVYASVFSESVLEQVELGGIGRLVAATSNDDANSLAALHFAPLFGRNRIFQLAPEEKRLPEEVSSHLRGRILFGEGITHTTLTQRFLGEWAIKKTKLTENFGFDAFKAHYVGEVIPLFLITSNHKLQVYSPDANLNPQPGQMLISLVNPKAEQNHSATA
ncbi:MAG: cation:proton antiporter [Thiobacillaceae bacterium]